MNHVAIDLGGRESQICVRNETGTVLEEERCTTTGLRRRLAQIPRSHVVMETCAEAFAVANWAKAAGHEVTVVPSSLVKSLGVGARGVKTDVRDARNLSEAACRMSQLPSVHVPSARSRELKELSTMRESLVSARTKLINTTRSWLRMQGLPALRGGNANRFASKFRKHVETHLGCPPTAAIDRQLICIEAMTEQMMTAEKELHDLAEEDDVCRRLMTVPGVGPLVALRFLAAIDDVTRFEGAHVVGSYLGLTPGERSSSDTQRRTGITKAGSPRVRWILQQAAWSAWRSRPNDPMVRWAWDLSLRRGRKIAAVALARKIAGIMYAIWRDGSTYRADAGAASSTTT